MLVALSSFVVQVNHREEHLQPVHWDLPAVYLYCSFGVAVEEDGVGEPSADYWPDLCIGEDDSRRRVCRSF